jgi:RNA polymerase sigma-70 factor, ECF subfamily
VLALLLENIRTARSRTSAGNGGTRFFAMTSPTQDGRSPEFPGRFNNRRPKTVGLNKEVVPPNRTKPCRQAPDPCTKVIANVDGASARYDHPIPDFIHAAVIDGASPLVGGNIPILVDATGNDLMLLALWSTFTCCRSNGCTYIPTLPWGCVANYESVREEKAKVPTSRLNEMRQGGTPPPVAISQDKSTDRMLSEVEDAMKIQASSIHYGDLHSDVVACLPALRAYARILTCVHDHADALVRRTIVLAMRVHRTLRPRMAPRIWLFTILHDLHYEGRYTDRRRSPVVRELSNPMSIHFEEEGAAIDMFLRAFWQLDDDQREALILEGAGGLTRYEAATVCGCTARTLGERISDARHELLSQLRLQPLSKNLVEAMCLSSTLDRAGALDRAGGLAADLPVSVSFERRSEG